SYGSPNLDHLLPGSSGSSGRYLQGSGAGGGAIELKAGGDLVIAPGTLISLNGGKGRENNNVNDKGGSGSGGAIRLIGATVTNNGLIEVKGGASNNNNLQGGGGRIAFASPGVIQQGSIALDGGTVAEVRPPIITSPLQSYLVYDDGGDLKTIPAVVGYQDMTLWYKFDESSGSIAIDSFDGRSGTLVNMDDSDWVAGKFGNALSFDGANDRVDGALASHATGNALTLSFWANGGASLPKATTIVESGNPNRVLNVHFPWNNGRIYWDAGSNDYTDRIDKASSVAEYQGSWQYWAFTKNTSTGIMNIYLNGVMWHTGGNKSRPLPTSAVTKFRIGSNRDGNNNFWEGLLDDFRMYQKELSATEIATIAQGNDFGSTTTYLQYLLTAANDPSSWSVDGLPTGLHFDDRTGEILGRPQAMGTFPVSLTVSNLAGSTTAQLNFVVDPAPAKSIALRPAEVASTSATLAAKVISSGGNDPSFSFFWGNENAGDTTAINPADPNAWDHRTDVNGTFGEGAELTAFISGLDMNAIYYYRARATNSVTSSWASSTEENLAAYWSFDESSGLIAADSSEGGARPGTLLGMDESNHVFGKRGKALQFNGGSVEIQGYKGIGGTDPRTMTAWIKTTNDQIAIMSWGENLSGEKWTFRLDQGKLRVEVNGGSRIGTAVVNDGQWHHVAAALPAGADGIEDVVFYVDGSNDAATGTANFAIDTAGTADLKIGNDFSNRAFDGFIDEVRLYASALSLDDVASLYLDGGRRFTTLTQALPPRVEVSQASDVNGTGGRLNGDLISYDGPMPTITLYWGDEDAGNVPTVDPADNAKWDHAAQVNGGNPVNAGPFSTWVSGLQPGQTYYYRAHAVSGTQEDWSSGDPTVRSGMIAHWRLDELSGTATASDTSGNDHSAPLNNFDNSAAWVTGRHGGALSFDGINDRLNLTDGNNFLKDAFEGRTVSFWINAPQDSYVGPSVTRQEDLAGYWNFDEGSGTVATDISGGQANGDVQGSVAWINGKFNKAIDFNASDERIEIANGIRMENLQEGDYSISLWFKPSSAIDPLPGLLGGTLSGDMDVTSPNPGNLGIDALGPSASESNGAPWAGNTTIIYTGQIFLDDGNARFRENIDDRSRLFVNGAQVFDNASWNQPAEGSVNLTNAGWYDLELRMSNGGGGQGLVNPGPGFGWDPTGGTSFVHPQNSDASTMDVFRTFEPDNLLATKGSFMEGLRFTIGEKFGFVHHLDDGTSVDALGDTNATINGWHHLTGVVDKSGGTAKIYLNGAIEVSVGFAGDTKEFDRELWHLASGADGTMDDVRFYSVALSAAEVSAIHNGGAGDFGAVNGYTSQMLFDEGGATNGFGVKLENGVLSSIVKNSTSTATITDPGGVIAPGWRHVVASFGDGQRNLKLYLDGTQIGSTQQLTNTTVSTHTDGPAFGGMNGSNPFAGPQYFKGIVDDLRVYDRGLSAEEIAQIYNGDMASSGLAEFRAPGLPAVVTVSASNVTPAEARLNFEVTSNGGIVTDSQAAQDLRFRNDSIGGLALWLKGTDLLGLGEDTETFANGDSIPNWRDASGMGKHFEYTQGNPTYVAGARNGLGAVNFDGDDVMWSDRNFDSLTGNGYTILSVARYTGGDNQRLISSRTRNWLFGFHNNGTKRFYAEGWIS
ncbi:MAG: LamG-like jellyroll fold domain-containing protein, partial [Opitutales bacterium]